MLPDQLTTTIQATYWPTQSCGLLKRHRPLTSDRIARGTSSFARCLFFWNNGGFMVPLMPSMTRKPHFRRQEKVAANGVSAAYNTACTPKAAPVSVQLSAPSAGASSQVLASSAHSHITPTVKQSPSTQHQPLDLALQQSARSSLESARPDLLDDPLPLSFAPTMAAQPGGYS